MTIRNNYYEFASRDPDLALMRRLWEDDFNEDTLLRGKGFCGKYEGVDKLIYYSNNVKISS